MHKKNEFDQITGLALENWRPVSKPPHTCMYGTSCTLEPLDPDQHAAKLFDSLKISNQGASWTYLPYGPFNTLNDFHKWLMSTIATDNTLLYVIIDNKTNLPVGLAGYSNINPEHGTIEVGHLHFSALLKKTRGATEAMYLMMHRALDTLGYRRYEWRCNSLNKASWSAAERLGFKFEGIFRQHHVFKNYNRDTAWFSIIDSEWPSVKERLEKWLDPKNFDRNGKQIVSLKNIS